MPWRWWRRRQQARTNGGAQAHRYLQRIQAQQAEVDQMVRQIEDHADAFTDAMTRALGGSA